MLDSAGSSQFQAFFLRITQNGQCALSLLRLHNFINRVASEVVFQLSALDLVRVRGDSQIGTPELPLHFFFVKPGA